jgi:hypothetical protein
MLRACLFRQCINPGHSRLLRSTLVVTNRDPARNSKIKRTNTPCPSIHPIHAPPQRQWNFPSNSTNQ